MRIWIYNRFNNYVYVIILILISFFLSTIINIDNASATSSTLSISISNSNVSMNMVVLSTNGTFAKSNESIVSVTTNNATGYTLSLAARTNDSSPRALKNSSDSSATLNSITSNIDEVDFSSLIPTADITNKWGYYFIRHGSIAQNGTHTFSPAPNTTGTIIDTTNAANPTTPNQYDLAIGARVDDTVKLGSYTNAYLVVAVTNPIPYIITYTDTLISNMPVDANELTTMDTNVPISSLTPRKSGYTFIGWCSTAPTTDTLVDTCSGTTYQPGSNYVVNQTSSGNELNLYAMWRRNTMQNVSDWKGTLNINDETTAIDTRDGKVYHVARLCMNTAGCTAGASDPNDTNSILWMTQNLDLVIGPSGVEVLTSDDSDINVGSGTIYATGYSASNGIITWTPNSTLRTPANSSGHAAGSNTGAVTGWTNSNTAPYQGEGGDYYLFTSGNTNSDTIYKSLNACINAGHTAELCSHYHVGNYYNWTAAVASNNSTNFGDSGNGMPYAKASNSICPKGWRLPNGLSGSTASNDNHITEFNRLALAYGITTGRTVELSSSTTSGLWKNVGWATDGFNNFRTAPLYFIRSGIVGGTALDNFSTSGYLWSSSARSGSIAYCLAFGSSGLLPASQVTRNDGFPVRCVAR